LVVPFLIVFAIIACSLAYVTGVYLIGRAIGARFTTVATAGRKVVVLALSLILAGLLTMIPFLGWLISLGIVAYGFGVIAAMIMTHWSADDRSRLAGLQPNDASARPTPGLA